MVTPIMRRALEAIELHRGFRRSELTSAEKRTATALLKRGFVFRDCGYYIITPAGRRAIGLPGNMGGSLAESADD